MCWSKNAQSRVKAPGQLASSLLVLSPNKGAPMEPLMLHLVQYLCPKIPGTFYLLVWSICGFYSNAKFSKMGDTALIIDSLHEYLIISCWGPEQREGEQRSFDEGKGRGEFELCSHCWPCCDIMTQFRFPRILSGTSIPAFSSPDLSHPLATVSALFPSAGVLSLNSTIPWSGLAFHTVLLVAYRTPFQTPRTPT